MELILDWEGPVGPGNFPVDILECEALAAPGIYLRIKRYENARTVAYVGQSVNLLSRFDQHLRDILTFSVDLRNRAGDVILPRDGGDRAAAYNRLGVLAPVIAGEAQRTEFLYARCGELFDPDYLSATEALLKERLEQRLGGALETLENRQGISTGGLDEEVIIYSETGRLDDDFVGLLIGLLGNDPVRFCLPAMEPGT